MESADRPKQMTPEAVGEAIRSALHLIADDWIPKQTRSIFEKEGRTAAIEFLRTELMNGGGGGPNVLSFQGTPKGLKLSLDYGGKGPVIGYPVILDQYVLVQGNRGEAGSQKDEEPIKSIKDFVRKLVDEHSLAAPKEYRPTKRIGALKKQKVEELLRGLKRKDPSTWEIGGMAGTLFGRATDSSYPADPPRIVAYKRDRPRWFIEGATRIHLDKGMRLVSYHELETAIAKRTVAEILATVRGEEYLTGDLRGFKVAELKGYRQEFQAAGKKVGVDVSVFDEVVEKARPKNVRTVLGYATDSAWYEIETAERYLLEGQPEEAKKWVAHAQSGYKDWVKLQADACGAAPDARIQELVGELKEAISRAETRYYITLSLDYSTNEWLVLGKSGELTLVQGNMQPAKDRIATYPTEAEAKRHTSEFARLLKEKYGSRKRPEIRKVGLLPEPFYTKLMIRAAEARLRKQLGAR